MMEIVQTHDFEKIEQLAHIIWKEAYEKILSDEQIQFMLNDFYTPEALAAQSKEGHLFLLLKYDGIPEGFASYSQIESDVYKVHKLYLHKSLRGKGAGTMMLDYITAQVRAAGGSRLQLNVNRNNPAKDFYLRLGFEIIESVDIPYRHFVLDDFVLERKV